MKEEIVIEAQNLSKVYQLNASNGEQSKKFNALDDVSFQIKKGENVAIVGANGSGKSTLLKVLAGVTKPSSGTVKLKGKVASILDIGAGFHPELSGKENIYVNGQLLGFKRKEIKSKVDEIITFSGIGRFIDEPVKNYSNGMYLRLAFSIVIHLDFDIYLFDEVMSVGDAEFLIKSKNKINQLIESEKTIVIVNHNIHSTTNFTKFIEINKGKILQSSNNENLFSSYISRAIQKTSNNLYTKAFSISDFTHINKNKSVTVESIEVYHPGKNTVELETDHPLEIAVKYQKGTTEQSLNLILTLSDTSGIIILVTSPIINGIIEESKDQGIFEACCRIPKNFFNSNIYSLGLTFVSNAEIIKSINNNSNDNLSANNYKLVHSFQNIVYFRLKLIMPGLRNLENLNFSTGLIMPDFDWKIKKHESKA